MGAQKSRSRCNCFAYSCGASVSGSRPICSKAVRSAGSLVADTIAVCSASMVLSGVPGGAKIP